MGEKGRPIREKPYDGNDDGGRIRTIPISFVVNHTVGKREYPTTVGRISSVYKRRAGTDSFRPTSRTTSYERRADTTVTFPVRRESFRKRFSPVSIVSGLTSAVTARKRINISNYVHRNFESRSCRSRRSFN